MPDDKLQKIRETLAAGDVDKARKMLRWVLKHEPSADAWVMAAEMTSDTEQKTMALRQALALNALHGEANRLLLRLEGSSLPLKGEVKSEWERKVGEKPVTEIKRQLKQTRFQEQAQRQRWWTRVGCVSMVILSISLSFSVYRAIGLMPSMMSGRIAGLFGQPTPVTEIDGIPLSEVDYAAMVMTPTLRETTVKQDVQILDAGYMHEHTFRGNPGEEYAIYIQFLSLNANNVPRNITLVDPDGYNATGDCVQGNILQGATNITLTCVLKKAGIWAVRVVGRDGESVGVYFIGVEKLSL